MESRLFSGFEAKHCAVRRGHIRQHVDKSLRADTHIANTLIQTRHYFYLAGDTTLAVENHTKDEVSVVPQAAHRTDQQVSFPCRKFVSVVNRNVPRIKRTWPGADWHPEGHWILESHH